MTDYSDDLPDILPADEEQGMFEHFRFLVDKGQEPMRVDKYMSTHMEDTSRHRIQCAIKEQYVRVNDKLVKANYIVRPGDVIRFVMPYRRRGLEIIPQDIPLDIVYEEIDEPERIRFLGFSCYVRRVGRCFVFGIILKIIAF